MEYNTLSVWKLHICTPRHFSVLSVGFLISILRAFSGQVDVSPPPTHTPDVEADNRAITTIPLLAPDQHSHEQSKSHENNKLQYQLLSGKFCNSILYVKKRVVKYMFLLSSLFNVKNVTNPLFRVHYA